MRLQSIRWVNLIPRPMPRFGPQLVFTTVALIGALMGGTQAVQAGKTSEDKGDETRCRVLQDRIADLGGNAEEPGT